MKPFENPEEYIGKALIQLECDAEWLEKRITQGTTIPEEVNKVRLTRRLQSICKWIDSEQAS